MGMNVCSLEGNKKKIWLLHSLQNKTTIPLFSGMIRRGKSNFQCIFKFLTLQLMKYCKNLYVLHETELSWILLCYKSLLQQIHLVHNSSVHSAILSSFSAVAEVCIFGLKQFSKSCWTVKHQESHEAKQKWEAVHQNVNPGDFGSAALIRILKLILRQKKVFLSDGKCV